MPQRKITLEERDRAIKEADQILRLGKKWQRNVPNERRPNFEAAAASILRRTLGSKVTTNRKQPMQIKADALQHEHNEREARLLERTLKIGTLPREVLHSFQTGRARKKAQPLRITPPGFRIVYAGPCTQPRCPGSLRRPGATVPGTHARPTLRQAATHRTDHHASGANPRRD